MRTILYALGANLAIAAAKTAAAIATGSSAMLAEAIHSYADSGNQGLLLWGMRQAKRPPSPDYPLGWGKAVFFWSFIVALVLFSLGGLFSLYEGWHKLAHPAPIRFAWVAVGILVFGLIAETTSLRGGRHAVLWAQRGSNFAPRLPARSEQGARRTQPVALVPREPAERAGGDPGRGPRRAPWPRARPACRSCHHVHRQPRLGRARLHVDVAGADPRRGRPPAPTTC